MSEDALKQPAGGRGLEEVLAELSQFSVAAQAEQEVPLLRQGLPPGERFGLAPREVNNLQYWAFTA